MARKKNGFLRLQVTIDCEGAAFEDYANGELARVLGGLADQIEQAASDSILSPEGLSLFDINGNRCGIARIVGARRREIEPNHRKIADRIDGYDLDDLGESPDC
jgi:hypothetical protein